MSKDAQDNLVKRIKALEETKKNLELEKEALIKKHKVEIEFIETEANQAQSLRKKNKELKQLADLSKSWKAKIDKLVEKNKNLKDNVKILDNTQTRQMEDLERKNIYIADMKKMRDEYISLYKECEKKLEFFKETRQMKIAEGDVLQALLRAEKNKVLALQQQNRNMGVEYLSVRRQLEDMRQNMRLVPRARQVTSVADMPIAQIDNNFQGNENELRVATLEHNVGVDEQNNVRDDEQKRDGGSRKRTRKKRKRRRKRKRTRKKKKKRRRRTKKKRRRRR